MPHRDEHRHSVCGNALPTGSRVTLKLRAAARCELDSLGHPHFIRPELCVGTQLRPYVLSRLGARGPAKGRNCSGLFLQGRICDRGCRQIADQQSASWTGLTGSLYGDSAA